MSPFFNNAYMKIFHSFNFLVFVGVAIFSLPALAKDATQNIEQFTKRADELVKKLNTCGADVSCINELSGQFQELQSQLGALGNIPAPAPAPNMAEQQAISLAVAQAMESKKHDPCYPVLYEKETYKRVTGQELIFVDCIHLKVTAQWNVKEWWTGRPFYSADRASYELEETYPAYLRLVYDKRNRKVINDWLISSPHQIEANVATARIVNISADYPSERPGLFTTKRHIFNTKNSAHFILHPEPALSFTGSGDKGIEGSLTATTIEVDQTKFIDPDYDYVGGSSYSHNVPPASIDGIARVRFPSDAFSLEDIKNVIKRDVLTKEFPLDYDFDYFDSTYHRSGKVTLTIAANESELRVSPNQIFTSSGPDGKGLFHPPSKGYTLKNVGNAPIKFTVRKTAAWIELDKREGVINPQASTKVKVSIGEKAKSLEDGTYKDTVQFNNVANGKGSTTRQVVLEKGEEQQWRAAISGFESIEEKRKVLAGNSAFRELKHGMNFTYDLIVEFTIKKKKGKWVYKNGRIKTVKINYKNLYDPAVWQTKKAKCLNCQKVTSLAGQGISGTVVGNNAVHLNWTDLRAKIEIDAKVKIKCVPKKECDWGTAYFESDKFVHWMSGHALPLKNGAHVSFKPKNIPKNDQITQTLQHDYVMKRIK